MTVCTASIFAWNYDLKKEGGDWGFAIAAAADRMLTDVGLGIEYEGSRWKGVGLGNKQVVLVAGDMAVHSEILRRLNQDLQTNPLESTHDTAERVAKLFREYRAEEAARQYLAPKPRQCYVCRRSKTYGYGSRQRIGARDAKLFSADGSYRSRR